MSNYQGGQSQYDQPYSDVIAKAAAKNKFVDFRNGLAKSNPDEYAMMHGIGGAKHAPRSVIKMMITDYSMGTGENSKVVTYNLDPHVIYEWLRACEKNFGRSVGGAVSSVQPVDLSFAISICEAMLAVEPLPASMDNMVYRPISDGMIYDLINELQSIGGSQSATPVQTSSAGYFEYTYHGDKVNPYKERNGLCHVQVIDVARQEYRSNGQLSMYPWYIKIQNFWSKPVQKENGTNTYDPTIIENKVEAFINISDEEFFKCCLRTTRFIEIWEYANCTAEVKRVIAEKNARRMQRASGGE